MDLNISNIYNDSVAAFNVMRNNIVIVVAPAAILVHNSVTVLVVNPASLDIVHRDLLPSPTTSDSASRSDSWLCATGLVPDYATSRFRAWSLAAGGSPCSAAWFCVIQQQPSPASGPTAEHFAVEILISFNRKLNNQSKR